MKVTIYNEDTYLNNDPTALKELHEEYLERKQAIEVEKVKYANILKNYNELINQIAMLLHSLGYKSSIECSIMLSFLIHNGYLSNDLLFTAEPQDYDKEITSKLGTSIVVGNGCCRNFSQIHKDVFTKLGLYSRELYVYSGTNIAINAKNAPANHVISLIDYEGQIYGIDNYNGDRLYHFKSPFILREIATFAGCNLRYKPYYEIIKGESNIEEIKKQLELLKQFAKRPFICPYDYEDVIKYETKNRLRKLYYDFVFDDFHEQVQPLKKEIHDEMISHFGRLY